MQAGGDEPPSELIDQRRPSARERGGAESAEKPAIIQVVDPHESLGHVQRATHHTDVRQATADFLEGSTEASTCRDSSEFEVSLLRGLGLGIDVNQRDRQTLLVTRVACEGSVAKHNKRSRSHWASLPFSFDRSPRKTGEGGVPDEIMPGDRIVEVNGIRGDVRNMISRIKGDDHLRLTLRRLEEITVSVARPPESLDLKLQSAICADDADAVSLEVLSMHGILIMSPVDMQVEDRIVALNGVRGDATRLRWELQDARLPAEVVIRRMDKCALPS